MATDYNFPEPSKGNEILARIFGRTPPLKVSMVINEYLAAKSGILSPHTILDYSKTLRRFREYLTDTKPFGEITPRDVRAFLSVFPGGRKNKLNAHIALSALWTFAIKEGYTQDHILRRVDPPKPERRVIIPFSKGEFMQLLEAAFDTRGYKRNVAILLLLVDTGIRASELCGLRNRDVRDDWIVVFGKGSKERTVPITLRTSGTIYDYQSTKLEAKPDDPLFISEQNRPLTRDALRLTIERLGQRSGVTKAHAHRFRHTFAVNYLLNGGDAISLQNILGHSTPAMTQRYVHMVSADIAAIHKRASPVSNWAL